MLTQRDDGSPPSLWVPRVLTNLLFVFSYVWFVPIKWMKVGVEQPQFWLLQETGVSTQQQDRRGQDRKERSSNRKKPGAEPGLPVLSCPFLSLPVLSCPFLNPSCLFLSCPFLNLSCLFLSCPFLSCPELEKLTGMFPLD